MDDASSSSSDDDDLVDLGDVIEDEEEPREALTDEEERWISAIEASVLAGAAISNDKGQEGEWTRCLRWAVWIGEGRYDKVLLETPLALRREAMYHEKRDIQKEALSPAFQILRQRCKKYARDYGAIGARELTMLGAAALRAYEQLNYTGPLDDETSKAADFAVGIDGDCLEFAGEPASPFVAAPGLLALARAAGTTETLAGAWWAARAATYHGRALNRGLRRATAARKLLWDTIDPAFTRVLSEVQGDVRALALLERGLAKHHFDEDGRGKSDFRLAADAANLKVELTAALGKRTKFQTTSLPQLRLDTNLYTTRTENNNNNPEVVPLGTDSILLEAGVNFDEDLATTTGEEEEDDEASAGEGQALRQAIVLALCLDVKNSNPEDGLTTEEMRPYVDAAQESAVNWLVYSTALLQKCRLELASRYSADRAVLQLQVLVDQHATCKTTNEDPRLSKDDADSKDRVQLCGALDYPAIWEMKREVASAMARLGAYVSAAELYAAVEQFDAVVECYAAAGRRDEAVDVVKKQIAHEKATPTLWCVLGDMEDDPRHYERAWIDSKERSPRAARSLGRRFAKQKKWSDAIPWFQRALTVAPFAPATWFDLGIAHMRCGDDWDLAARAFSRAAAQEPEDADSWANLAAVRIQLTELKPALAALDAALKIRGDDWRLWENHTRVAAALGDRPALVVRGLDKLLDLRPQSKRPVDSILDQLSAVIDQVAVLEAEPTHEDDSSQVFNASRAATALDSFIDRLLVEAPAVPGTATATLWDIVARRATQNPTRLRDLRSRKARALLLDDAVHHDALFDALLEFSDALNDDDDLQERRNAALFLRSVVNKFPEIERRTILQARADSLAATS